jgi:glycosyltransferase involved in cell wall biosynthesis
MTDLFSAVYQLDDQHRRNLCLLVAGSGPLEPEVISGLGELEKVGVETLYLGSLNPAGMKQLYNALDFLVVPSRTRAFWKEQFGRVIVEAEACGVVALGSGSGAIPEVIGDSSRIFKECDPASLAELLTQQLSKFFSMNPDDRLLLRRKMQARALQRYGDRKLAERFYIKLSQSIGS